RSCPRACPARLGADRVRPRAAPGRRGDQWALGTLPPRGRPRPGGMGRDPHPDHLTWLFPPTPPIPRGAAFGGCLLITPPLLKRFPLPRASLPRLRGADRFRSPRPPGLRACGRPRFSKRRDTPVDDTGAPVTAEALFGAVLRSFRKGGLRQTAAKIPINFSHLAKWERGERPVPEEMIAALDRAYAANGALITLHQLITRDRLRSTTALACQPTPGQALLPALPGHGPPGVLERMWSAIGAVTGTPIQVLHALAGVEELSAGIQLAVEQRDGLVVEEW